MKYIKHFEKNETVYSLIGYSNDNEKILMSQKEFDLFNMTNFTIRYKRFTNTYTSNIECSWTYADEEKNEIKDWLESYRMTGDPDFYSATKNYNL